MELQFVMHINRKTTIIYTALFHYKSEGDQKKKKMGINRVTYFPYVDP